MQVEEAEGIIGRLIFGIDKSSKILT